MLQYSPRGGGNATVPNDAPIHPAQAFVDTMIRFSTLNWKSLNFSSLGITGVANPFFYDSDNDLWLIYALVGGVGGGAFNNPINFSNNSLGQATINQILSEMVLMESEQGPGLNFTLNLSGQTPAAPPSGQGITDKTALITAGWTVTTD